MGVAQFRVSPELIREALKMPDTSQIVNGWWENQPGGVLVLVAEDLLLPAGRHECEPICTSEQFKWDWNVT